MDKTRTSISEFLKNREGNILLLRTPGAHYSGIFCEIISNGKPVSGFYCCCLCKQFLRSDKRTKGNRSRHWQKHFNRGERRSKTEMDNLVNAINRSSL